MSTTAVYDFRRLPTPTLLARLQGHGDWWTIDEPTERAEHAALRDEYMARTFPALRPVLCPASALTAPAGVAGEVH